MRRNHMAKALYLDDMGLREFESNVISVSEGRYIVLESTAFYPRSGGVMHDTGHLQRKSDGKDFKVIFTGKFDDEISHEVDEAGLQVGDSVIGSLDWERRYLLMRYHTAAHVLSGVFWKEGNVKISGNEIDVQGGRMDFTLEDFDRDTIEGYVSKANEIVEKDLPVDVYYITREDLDNDPDLTKLAMGLPKGISEVRIVDIRGFDRQPDGGCHVGSTREIGPIKLIKMKNKGKNNRRMYFEIV